ncbi:hypothetical protein TNCV_432601 [Trichonephila clavipes]|nr:hypothetical protein TNCV_432601 [Trichonephila clavipes]
MPTFRITRQVGKPNFACVVLAELAAMCFVSYNVANAVANNTKDRVSGAGGGIAFLVKTHEIKYIEILPTSNTSSSTEAQAINILLSNHTITLVNVYHPDNSLIDTNILQDLTSTSAYTKRILGDFNAMSPSWGCKILDSKGDQLKDLADYLNLTILNTGENTYVSKTNGTALALHISAISYASANNAHWKVLDAAISDHFPVLTTLPIVQEPTTQEKRLWNFRKANWDGFTQELESLCSDLPKHNDAEKLLRLFTSCIAKTAKHHISRGKLRNNWIPLWKDHNIKDLIQERDSIGQELQRNNSEEFKRNFIEVIHRVEELILEVKKKSGLNYVANWTSEKEHRNIEFVKGPQ